MIDSENDLRTTADLQGEDTAHEYGGLDAAVHLSQDAAALAAEVQQSMADGIVDTREGRRIERRAAHLVAHAAGNVEAWAESIVANVEVAGGLTLVSYDLRREHGDARAKRPQLAPVTVADVLQWAQAESGADAA